ncbi:competence protein ComER [Paenibacillus sp. DS2015]|uniref:late competence protein ComER n=1 Tax=Paenibacillus sp. DS2015 TaxID=3373917 RepID=UPI003D21680D
MKVGFIGTGSMGSLLLDAFIYSDALHPEHLFVSNRSTSKLLQLSQRHEGINVCQSNIETVRKSQIIFICVKPLQFKAVIQEIQDHIQPEQLLVSITSPVQLYHLENNLCCKVAKVIPSVTHKVNSGSSLVMYGSRLTDEDRLLLHHLLSHIGKPVEINELQARIFSDFSSCGPAFISFFLTKWMDAAVEMTGVDREQLTFLTSEMILGTGRLLTQGDLSPLQLQEVVAVPGGITAQALAQLNHSLDGTFHNLITTTHNKYVEDLQKLDQTLGHL